MAAAPTAAASMPAVRPRAQKSQEQVAALGRCWAQFPGAEKFTEAHFSELVALGTRAEPGTSSALGDGAAAKASGEAREVRWAAEFRVEDLRALGTL